MKNSNEDDGNNKKKATTTKTTRAHPQIAFSSRRDDGTFFASRNRFAATIYGPPRPYKRPGYGTANGKRYNPNKPDQLGFVKALRELYKHDAATSYFGSSELQITVVFCLSRNSDIDNLLKYLLDALQLAKMYDNDMQVTKISAEKQSVHDATDVARTYFILEKRVIEID